MQRQAPNPSHHWFFVGSNLQEATTSILQAKTCKEAPTPIYFLQATTYRRLLPQLATNGHISSYNLIWKHQLPHTTMKTHADLPGYQLYYVPSSLLSSNLHICLISSLNLHRFSIFSSFFLHSLISYNSLTFFFLSHQFCSSLTHYAYASNIIYRDHLIVVCISRGIWNEQVWLFSFPLLIFLSSTSRII